MNPILAQMSQPTDHESVVWVIIACGVVALAWMIIQIIQSFRRQPSIEAEYATKKELTELRKEFADTFTRLEQKIETTVQGINTDLGKHNTAAEERASKIHKRIDAILRGVSIIQGRCSAFHGQVPQEHES